MQDQHARKVESIQRRIDTALSRGSLDKSVLGFRGMETKAKERFADLMAKLDNEPAPTIALTPVAACVLEVIE